ncbi:MAG: hypothetical protein K9K37_02800 [Desulfocapsa sp.]|nr:hypothetical protein [Desulfocapsa sp.]
MNKKTSSCFLVLLLLLLFGVIYFLSLNKKNSPGISHETELLSKKTQTKSIQTVNGFVGNPQIKDPERLSNIVHKILNNEKINAEIDLENTSQVVSIVLRNNGLRIADAWSRSGSTVEALKKATIKAKEQLTPKNQDSITSAEICFLHSFQELRYADKRERKKLLGNIHRGMKGIEISFNDTVEIYPPTNMIATNRSPKRIIELYKKNHSLTEKQLEDEVAFRTFAAYQLLVELGQNPKTIFMERGNTFVPIEAVTKTNVQNTAELAAEWLINNLDADGRMTYKYWPSRGEESAANNMIRQWMATVALEKIAAKKNSEQFWRVVEQNIDYNLAHFFQYTGNLGIIKWNGKAKLGSLALAALAINQHPKREKWASQERALHKSIDTLWQQNGSFITFYEPWGRNDNQNFYPGEALLYWAVLYEKENDQELLSRIMKSFAYYKNWHLQQENRNPAFIPWHTQAYYLVWKKTKNEELKQFIFEMNDWLLQMQQWSDLRYPDLKGRFYDPDKPYGPPHASATGVYLEGLIDAYKLAKETNDLERQSRYKKAILRGIRSVMQLQFTDEVDMFYVSDKMKNRVKGGIRTTVYDNRIRSDNVQHNLLALLKILEYFNENDF